MTKVNWILAVVLLVAWISSGCAKSGTTEVSDNLIRSFESSAPSAKSGIEKVTEDLDSGNYTKAIVGLTKVVGQGPITDEQRTAVSAAVGHVMKAVDHDSAANNPLLHQLMANLIVRANGEN